MKSTPDDAYYYFQIAHNLANGRNVTFDGETVTNGFHPLWLIVITPVYWLTGGDTAVHVILSLGAILGAATVVLIHDAARRVTGSYAAATAGAAVYALHPQMVADSVNGVESALLVFLTMAVVWQFVRIAQHSAGCGDRAWAALGLTAGLMVLARTDAAFMLPLLLGYLLYKSPSHNRWRRLGLFAVPALAPIAVWGAWSLAATGTVVQVSGQASGWFSREAYLQEHGDALSTQVQRGAELTWETLGERLPHRYFVPHSVTPWAAMLAGGCALAGALAALRAQELKRAATMAVLTGLPLAGVLAALGFHAAYRWQVREWYFTPSAALGVLCLAVAIHVGATATHRLTDASGRHAVARWVTAGFYAVVAVALLALMRPHQPTAWVYYPGVFGNQLAAARWLEANTEPGTRVGSFNAGIIGYYSDRTVVNLDGVVNADAFEALQSCRVYPYVTDMRLEYLADLPTALNLARCGAPEDPYEEVAVVGKPVFYADRGLIQILRVKKGE